MRCVPKRQPERHAKGYRTARENLADLVDADSFVEYGQLAVAAQRKRRDYEDLQISTAADGVITGVATINRDQFGRRRISRCRGRIRLLRARGHPGLLPSQETRPDSGTGRGVEAAGGHVHRGRGWAARGHGCHHGHCRSRYHVFSGLGQAQRSGAAHRRQQRILLCRQRRPVRMRGHYHCNPERPGSGWQAPP